VGLKIAVVFLICFSSINLKGNNFSFNNYHEEDYSFGKNKNKNFLTKTQKNQRVINFLDIKIQDPIDGLWDFLFSAKDREGFVGVLLMLSSAGSAAVALGESGGKQNNFLLGAVALGATGLYLYNSHLNKNKTPRRKKEKQEYNPTDWEITEE
tara:strand:- start:8499 stop:8957 length:459 start_codon:yes stop_codon:yes gene_type:complete